MRKIRIFSASVAGSFGSVAENFGDNLMGLLLPRLFDVEPSYVEHANAELIGVGSILDAYHRRRMTARVPLVKRRPWRELHVWGSGFLNSNGLPLWPQVVRIHAVRGPLSQDKLGTRHVALGDPALLLPLAVTAKRSTCRCEVAVVPHFATYREFVDHFGSSMPRNWKVIDLTGDPVRVTEQIAKSEMVISSSLHGLIVADAYGIPSRVLQAGQGIKGDGFKYRDYEAFRGSTYSRPLSFADFLQNTAGIAHLMDHPCRPSPGILDELIAAFPFRS